MKKKGVILWEWSNSAVEKLLIQTSAYAKGELSQILKEKIIPVSGVA